MSEGAAMRDPSLCGMRLNTETPGVFSDCPKPSIHPGPYCYEHGCAKCGQIILADTEDWPERLCPEHYEVQVEHDKLMDAARAAQTTLSKGENGKKRKNSVERYLYQFMKGHGQTASKAFKDGWDRVFGAKAEPLDFDETQRKAKR